MYSGICAVTFILSYDNYNAIFHNTPPEGKKGKKGKTMAKKSAKHVVQEKLSSGATCKATGIISLLSLRMHGV